MRKFAALLFMLAIASPLLAQPFLYDERSVDVDHIKVHYTNFGKGDPTIVFVHGWACDETVWTEQAPFFAERMHTIAIDLPGHGQSDKPKTIEYDKDLYTRAIDGVVKDAGVKSVVLVGHSNGTPFTREYYRKFSTKVKALIVVEGPLHAFFDRDTMEKFVVPLKGDHYEEAMARVIAGMTKPIKDETLRNKIKALMMKTPQYVAVSEFEATADEELFKEDKIAIPVLMILAKQPAWSPEYEKFVRDLIPKLDYQVWENVSHFLMMEKPREFNAAVLKFLEDNKLLPNRS